jgi:O-antigen/teichoic acid export membrane protein
MTTKVVRGSLWTMSGQGVTMLTMLVTSPFVIRWLGAEAYGVLTLVNVLIGYLAFADMGMGLAATRFAAEVHARRDDDEEAATVWTAVLIAFVPTALCASALGLLAEPIVVDIMRLPARFHDTAVWALRLAALGFIARTMAGMFSTPQLVRLRMDLNTLVTGGAAITQNLLVVFVLWLQGGLIAAVAAIAGMAILTCFSHTIISQRLLPQLTRPRIRGALIKPLLRFGGGLVLSSLANVALVNLEKLFLPRFASVSALGYYGVAYSLAGVLAFAPSAMRQSLLPAFSRLHAASEHEDLKRLYTRALRGNVFWLAPAAMILCIIAKPFFTLWAGPEYGQESTIPFYILVVGLVFNVMAYVPHALLMAYGRSDLIGRFHLSELLPHLLFVIVFTYRFGAMGAALAWSLRVMLDALIFFLAAQRIAGMSFSPIHAGRTGYAIALAILLLPILLIGKGVGGAVALIGVSVFSMLSYAALVWIKVLTEEERSWVMSLLFWHKRGAMNSSP